MRYVLKGIKRKYTYTVDDGKENGKYVRRPYQKVEVEFVEYPEIMRFENDHINFFCSYIWISEDEQITVNKQKFRADLNETHLLTSKVVEDLKVGEKEAEVKCAECIRDFNKTMIESNEKLRAYCNVNKLSYEDTDVLELWKIVYPNEEWKFCDGKLVPVVYNAYPVWEPYTATLASANTISANHTVVSSSALGAVTKSDMLATKTDIATSGSIW